MTRALVVAAIIGAASCTGSQEARSARAALEEFTSQHPGAPVVVPVRWSEDWDWFEPDMWQSNSGRVTEVHFRIMPVDRTGQATIGVCVAPPGADQGVAESRPDAREEGWGPCDLGDRVMRRTVDGLETVIHTYGDEPPPDLWSDIELTTRWRSVDWLDDVAGGCCS